MSSLERAKNTIFHYLETFEDDERLPGAVTTLIASRDPEAIELLGEVATASPEAVPLEDLWTVVEDATTPVGARISAARAITRVLMVTWEDLEFDLPLEGDEPIMDRLELQTHIDRLMATYRSADVPTELRRRALECAANIAPDPSITAAGHAAFRSDDPDWIATGVLVVALADPEHSGAVVSEALENEDEGVRITAIQSLSVNGDEAEAARLAELARERDGDEQRAALSALADIPHPLAGQELFELGEELQGEVADHASEAYELWYEEWGGLGDEADFDDLGDFDDEFGDFEDDDDDDDDGGGRGGGSGRRR